MACFDLGLQHISDAQVLVFVKPPAASGKNKNLGAGVTEDEELHVPVEILAPPLVVHAFHVP